MASWEKYKNTNTLNLIENFQNTSNCESLRDDMYLAIMFRFREGLFKRVVNLCSKRNYDEGVATKITEETFKRYGKSKKFKASKSRIKKVDDSFSYYLYRIAVNVLNDFYQKGKKKKEYDGTEKIITYLPSINTTQLDIESKIIHETLKTLPPKELAVYLTYIRYEVRGRKLPSKLLEDLRSFLGVKQDTIRIIKKSAFGKVDTVKKVIENLKELI